MATTVNPISFVSQVRTELSRVIWPSRAETIRLTAVVIGVSVAIGLYIGTLDVALVKLTEILVK